MKRLIYTDQSIFASIREAGALYVDKTKQIYDCIKDGRYFFLSRPRRFGKSMLCTTLQALFSGQRELFKGLWIDSSDWKWEKHPVILLNMGQFAGKQATRETFREGLFNGLESIAAHYDIQLIKVIEPSLMFKNLIVALHQKYGKKTVIIIDEYDKPLLDKVLSDLHFSDIHGELKNFHGQLKHNEASIQFAFITGVYKFTKTSIFSDLNNLRDLTMDHRAGDLIGYTQKEVETNFAPEIATLAATTNISTNDLLHELRKNCNGYVFGINQSTNTLSTTMYNSFAINTIFEANEFKVDIWFGTGTPSFLIKQLEKRDFEQLRVDNLEIEASLLINSCEPDNLSIESLLYYAGYVTIKSYDNVEKLFTLKFPNDEIARAMAQEILPRMTEQRSILSKRASMALRDAWLANDFELVKEKLNICLGLLHNKLYTSSENYFQTVIMFFFQLVDIHIEAELGTNLGYIDLVLWIKKTIYIIEIKMDKSAKVALDQIKARRYYQGLLAEQKPIFLVGMSCSSKERAVTQLTVVPLET